MARRYAIPVIALMMALLISAVGGRPVNADPRDFTLINGSSIVIVEVYVAPSSSNDWGDDILGKDVLEPGGSVTIHFTRFDGQTCYYDILVKGKGGERGEENQIDLCSTTTVTFH